MEKLGHVLQRVCTMKKNRYEENKEDKVEEEKEKEKEGESDNNDDK